MWSGTRGSDIRVIIDGSHYQFYKNRRSSTLMLADLIAVIKDSGVITDTNILNSIETLKDEGNPAHHTGPKQFLEAEFLRCKPEVITLTDWIFNSFLAINIPSEIQGILSGKPKILHTFQPGQSLMNLGVNRKLFQNDLIFFTDDENQKIQVICDELIQNHHALLIGYPASGKSIMALSVAKKMQQEGYQAYYYSFKYETKHDLWDDIQPLRNRKIVFIIDDCHLNVESAANIYRLMYDVDANACLLFISRNISEDVQKVSQFEFNLFEELQDRTFTSETHEHQQEEKITGIVAKYQGYFQATHAQCYEIGDVQRIMTNIYSDLLVLSFYLSVWEETDVVLSDIDKHRVLQEIYDKYWKDLNRAQTACLLQYASLYRFEIDFESLLKPEYEEATKQLSGKGIIVQEKKDTYSFYHPSFAILLIDAYISEKQSIFRRKYKNILENFLLAHIREYILSFEECGYPMNLHTIFENLFIYKDQEKINGRKILERLFQVEEIKASIISFYTGEIEDAYYLSRFFIFLSKSNVDDISYFFQ